MTLPFKWENEVNTLWDSVGFWFDTFFVGSGSTICLSTRPNEKLTCWYQTLCLLKEPMYVAREVSTQPFQTQALNHI